MKAKKISEFKAIVESEGFVFECEERDLRKISFETSVRFFYELLNEEVNFTPYKVTFHKIGGWAGISLCDNDYGISRSIQIK